MKRPVIFLSFYFLIGVCSAQQELHIHQINIGNGDATLIGIYDTDLGKYSVKVLIDGGQLTPDQMLLPYINKVIGRDEESHHFEYIILSHYHNDHYNGLLAIQNGLITADSIIDPGGYKVSSYFNQTVGSGVAPASMNKALPWLAAIKAASRHKPIPYVKGRSTLVLRYGTDDHTSIGNKFVIGKIGSDNVELRCIAGWGNTLNSNGSIIPNPLPKKTSANNFTLAFILSCGEFRYFIGGDMGGKNGSYIDQETTVTDFLNEEYPKSVSISGDIIEKGHLCGFKANHHGSNESNTATFMEGLHPAVVFTSAGDNSGWHLPSVGYLQRLDKVIPLSVSVSLTNGNFNKGVYFTNLYDFAGGKSKKTANMLFKNKEGLSFDFGNDKATGNCSYLLKVVATNSLVTKSQFEVGRVDIKKSDPYKLLASFECHMK